MRRFTLIFAALLTGAAPAPGQKEYRAIRALLKANNGDGALNSVRECMKNEKFREDPELYHYGFAAYVKKNNALNEQAYLKQNLDTAALFNSVYGAFEFAMRCDTFDSRPDEKGRTDARYRKDHGPALSRLYTNLKNGGLYFIAKGNFPEAYKFFAMYIDAPRLPFFDKEMEEEDSLRIVRAAYWATVCAYQMKDAGMFFAYHEKALPDTAYRAKEMELAADMYAMKGDAEKRAECLRRGVAEFPTNYYFFSNLLDYYNERDMFGEALALSDSMLAADPRSVISLYGKSIVYLKMKRYDDCIAVSESLLQNDSTYAEVYYNIGASYYAKAAELDNMVRADMDMAEMRGIKRESDKLYRTALPYLEQYREMASGNIDRWGRPLYRIYLTLNMGGKFEEIDRLLLEYDAQKAADGQKAAEEKK